MADRVIRGILGTKLGMTQVFDSNNRVVPVTVVKAGPCVVTQLRTQENDGYTGVQLGFGTAKRLNKPQQGHLRASGANSRTVRRGTLSKRRSRSRDSARCRVRSDGR